MNAECRCTVGWTDVDCGKEALLSACFDAGSQRPGALCVRWTYDAQFLYAQVRGATQGWMALMLGSDSMVNGDVWHLWVDDATGLAHAEDCHSATQAVRAPPCLAALLSALFLTP